MNNLKKALGKDDIKKYSKKNVTTSFKKEVKWADIDDLIECRSIYKKTLQLSLQNHFSLIIQKSFESGQLKDFPEMVNNLLAKYQEFSQTKSNKKCNTLEIIYQQISQMLHDEKSAIMKKFLEISYQKLGKMICQERKRQKQANLMEFDNLVKILKPPTKKRQKVGSVQGMEKKKQKVISLEGNEEKKLLLGSLSGSNLNIKFTQEQYEIKTDLRKKKSQGNLNNIPPSPNPKGNEDYKAKLQSLLKEPMIKLVKTKLEYDYSAILEASKSNIQRRNRTHHAEVEKEGKKKINELRKDEGFIFYRPKK